MIVSLVSYGENISNLKIDIKNNKNYHFIKKVLTI